MFRLLSMFYLQKIIKQIAQGETNPEEFFRQLSQEFDKVSKFYSEKERWCHETLERLQVKVQELVRHVSFFLLF